MTERGVVFKLKGKKAVVRFDRRSACDDCHLCSVSKDGMKVEIVVENKLNANVGDFVEVRMGEKFVLTAAAIVYIIPLVLTAIGVGVGMLFSWQVQVGMAVAGLVLGFVIVAVLDRTVIKKKQGFAPEIVAICPPETAVEVQRAKEAKDNAGNLGIKKKTSADNQEIGKGETK